MSLEFGRCFREIAPESLDAFDAAAKRAEITIHFSRDGDEQTSTSAIRVADLGGLASVNVDMSRMVRLPGPCK